MSILNANDTSCPPGYSPDTILRLPMPVGPFNEPFGKDCFRNNLGVIVFASIIAFINLLCLILLFIDLTQRNIGPYLQTGFSSLFLVNFTSILFCFFAIFEPAACFSIWVFFTLFLWLSILSFMQVLIHGAMRIVYEVTKTKKLTELLGGPFVLAAVFLITVSTFFLAIIGAVGAAIQVYKSNITSAFSFWQIHSIGWAIYVGLILSYSIFMMNQFANEVENVSRQARPNLNDSGSVVHHQVHDIVKRFRLGAIQAIASFPLGCGAWIVHSFVLPVFWYLAFLHLCNGLLATIVLWYIYTPTPRKKRALELIFCCGRQVFVDEMSQKNPTPLVSAQVSGEH